MRKTIKLAVVAALALGSTSAFATNGDHLIGLGAKARGMGGVGIAISHGAESGLANPAMISSVKGSEISGTVTVFMPKVANHLGQPGMMYPTEDSTADMSIIPEISYASNINDNITWGLGMWGTAGMGVDYSGDANNFNMVTALQLMQIGVPVAYRSNGFSAGIAPVLQYGTLNIEYSGGLDASNMSMGMQSVSHSADVASAIGFGFTAGLGYEISDLTLGLVYKSAIAMDYKDQLSGATQPFANFGLLGGKALSDKLEQPAEIGLGVAYETMGHTIALDYKQIKWSSAQGYSDFGWEDQSVIAVGYQYQADGWAVRLGYNKGNNPVAEQDASATSANGGTGAALNMFNLMGFPATVESHMTFGGTYDLSKSTSVDLAYAIATEVTNTYSMAAFSNFGPMNPTQVETTHSQSSLSVQVNYAF